MGKRKRSQYGRALEMSDYEKQRMSKLMLNASRMEAVGLGTLATNILSSKYDLVANRKTVSKETSSEENDSEDSSDEDRGYEPTFDEGCEEELRIMQGFPLGKKVCIYEPTTFTSCKFKYILINNIKTLPSSYFLSMLLHLCLY